MASKPSLKTVAGWCDRCDRQVVTLVRRTGRSLAGNNEASIRCRTCEHTVRGEAAHPDELGGDR